MRILKNTANEVPVTVTEKQTTTIHDWLFEFKNEMTKEVKYCHAANISAYPTRCDLFMITDSVVEDPYNGTLNFSPTGSWSYKVYEMTQASPPVLVPTGYLAICETGSCEVFDSAANTDVNFNGNNNDTNAVFKD